MLLWLFSFNVNNSVGCKGGSWENAVLTRAEPVLFTVLSDLHRQQMYSTVTQFKRLGTHTYVDYNTQHQPFLLLINILRTMEGLEPHLHVLTQVSSIHIHAAKPDQFIDIPQLELLWLRLLVLNTDNFIGNRQSAYKLCQLFTHPVQILIQINPDWDPG